MLRWVEQVKAVQNAVDGSALMIVSHDGETILANRINASLREGDWVMQVDDARMLAVTAEALAAIDAARAAARAADSKPHIGQVVEWTSQAGGCTKTKRGTVVAIVAAGCKPSECIYGNHYKVDAGSLGRNHESYLVQVGNSRRLYWPLVSKLKVIS